MKRFSDRSYETHNHFDPDFPIIFHLNQNSYDFLHWHEGVEILYVQSGSCTICSDTLQYSAEVTDLAVINSSHLHRIKADYADSRFYCLILDINLCKSFGLQLEEIHFQERVQNETARSYFDRLIQEMTLMKPYYKTAAKLLALQLLLFLTREFSTKETTLFSSDQNKLNMVKKTLTSIHTNYMQPLTIDLLCSNVGISKYHFCRSFKDITGYTVIDYINLVRCSNARRLLLTGKYKIKEAALQCGYQNMSYFSKVYQKYNGVCPSETIR